MPNELFQARIPDEFAEEIHEYREERHMSKSEAVRTLFREGLDNEADDTPDTAGTLARIARGQVFVPSVLVAAIGWLMPYVALSLNAGTLLLYSTFVVASGLMFGGILTASFSLLAQVALARPPRQLVRLGEPEAEA